VSDSIETTGETAVCNGREWVNRVLKFALIEARRAAPKLRGTIQEGSPQGPRALSENAALLLALVANPDSDSDNQAGRQRHAGRHFSIAMRTGICCARPTQV